jgi:Domain of unknown function (DUF1929)
MERIPARRLAPASVIAALMLIAPPAHADPGSDHRARSSAEAASLGAKHAEEHSYRLSRARDPHSRALVRKLDAANRPRARAAQASAAEVGQWNRETAGQAVPIPVMGIHSVMLPTGKILWFAYPRTQSRDKSAPNTAQAYVFDPFTRQSRRIDPPIDPATGQPYNVWCAGQSVLADGQVLITGGNLDYPRGGLTYKGLKKVFTFNPYDETWTEQPDMRQGRWYPSNVLMPDGSSLIVLGYDETGQQGDAKRNLDIEMFRPAASLSGRGSMSVLSGPGHPITGNYPHMFTMPSGRVLVAGPYSKDSVFLTASGGSDVYGITDAPDVPLQRYYASAVINPGDPTRVTVMGGSRWGTGDRTATNTVVSLDEGNPGAGWRSEPPLNVGRTHHNTVILPDGSMVTVGGGYGQVGEDIYAAGPQHKAVEIWDPSTRAWRLGPSQVEQRTYHSTALLLPDGRVLSAGDDFHGGIDRDTAEVYEPPYLFRGARPDIESVQSGIRWGGTFTISTRSAGVTRAVLVAPTATTHAADMNQRHVALTVTRAADGNRMDVAAPPNANMAPPGPYMLFLLNDRGVPSVARFVRVGPAEDLTPAPRLGGAPTAAAGAPAGPGSAGSRRAKAVKRWRLGTFDRGRLRPWKVMSPRVRVTRPGHRSRYGMRLDSRAKGGAMTSRSLPRLGRGRYRITAWVRGRVGVGVGRDNSVGVLGSGRGSRRWRRDSVSVRVSRRGARPTLRMWTPRGGASARVDSVTLARLR